ncbi:RIP metalloprotease RseP [Candidatus Wolfebacteria bacterium]|nr:RIP metalloprotease RseP [Candidatus Wolfebacteria bacterium]
MSIIIFLIVLAVLIFVHELGHFLVAKKSGIRVDEFCIGFPPRIASWRREGDETRYAVGIIPFGGFVKIFGEDPTDEALSGPDAERGLVSKSKLTQVGVLGAGVFFNVLFAWVLISIGFMMGLPTSTALDTTGRVQDARLTVTGVLPDAPAAGAGLRGGDTVTSMRVGAETLAGEELNVVAAQSFIARHGGEELIIEYMRGEESGSVTVVPAEGIIPDAPAIGVALDEVGILKLSPPHALWQGARVTAQLTEGTTVGLWHFIADAVTGQAKLSQVTGPVGIVGLVGDASALGFVYLLSFTAFISINLALINLIPIPALDGGRILFVIIEAIKGSPLKPRVANVLNTVGFALLILLMLVVTWNDVARLVS